MISDKELFKKLDDLAINFSGQLDDLNDVTGLFYMGRLYGWKVQRLIVSRRIWELAIKLLGDPKELLPERGVLAHKSLGLTIIDKSVDYWDFIAGNISRESLPLHERKRIQ